MIDPTTLAIVGTLAGAIVGAVLAGIFTLLAARQQNKIAVKNVALAEKNVALLERTVQLQAEQMGQGMLQPAVREINRVLSPGAVTRVADDPTAVRRILKRWFDVSRMMQVGGVLTKEREQLDALVRAYIKELTKFAHGEKSKEEITAVRRKAKRQAGAITGANFSDA